MTTQYSQTDALLALLNIQKNLAYIEKELETLGISSNDREVITLVTQQYSSKLYNYREELAAIGEEHAIFTIDPKLNELKDSKTEAERALYILSILSQYNKHLTSITDTLIEARDNIKSDIALASLTVLMSESVGNILLLSQQVSETLTPLITTK